MKHGLCCLLFLCVTAVVLARDAQEPGIARPTEQPLVLRPYQVFSDVYRGFDSRSLVLTCHLLAPRSAFVSGTRCDVITFSRDKGREAPLIQANVRPLLAHGAFSHQALSMGAEGPTDRTDGFSATKFSVEGDAALIGIAICLPEAVASAIHSGGARIVVRWRFFRRQVGEDVPDRDIDYAIDPATIHEALSSPGR